jgi:hypothetical protein
VVGLWTAPQPELTLTDCLDLCSTAAMRKRFPIAAVGQERKPSFSKLLPVKGPVHPDTGPKGGVHASGRRLSRGRSNACELKWQSIQMLLRQEF